MNTLGRNLGVHFIKVCKICGAVSNRPYRCTRCEEAARKIVEERMRTKPRPVHPKPGDIVI